MHLVRFKPKRHETLIDGSNRRMRVCMCEEAEESASLGFISLVSVSFSAPVPGDEEIKAVVLQ